MLRWFAAPELPRPDLRRHARALWLVSWPFFAVVVAMLAIGVVVEPETLARRATTIAAVGVLITLLHGISRAGRPVLASWMLVIGLSAIVTQRAWNTGGIHAPVAVFYVLFIVMSGVLIGARGGIVTAAVCVLGATVLALATAFHWLAAPIGAGSALGGFVFVLLAIGVALVIHAPLGVRAGGHVDGLDTMRMLVHDMRSPLQIVLAHLDLLRSDFRGDARATDVEEAIGGALMLRRMTDSLLDVSKLESGRMPIQPSDTDLMTLARSVVESLRVLQPSRTVTVEGAVEVMCRCDVDLTRRLIDNLVGNAMKHTEIAGRVRVVVSSTGDKARIEVRDEGTGVPREKRGAIFARSGATSRRSPACASTGIGLTFCKLAVEVQGGEIRVEDAVPHGSVFIVELPLQTRRDDV